MAKKSKSSAKTMPMRALEGKGVPYQVHAHVHKLYTAEGVAEDLGISVAQVVKAMIVRCSDRSFVLVVIPGDKRLSLKKLSAVLKDKGLELASARDVRRVTGFQVGAVSVLGFRRSDVAAYVDEGVLEQEGIIISSGRPDAGLEIKPQDVLQVLQAQVGDFAS
jgi:Cys-tRNA(Pro) deacylase